MIKDPNYEAQSLKWKLISVAAIAYKLGNLNERVASSVGSAEYQWLTPTAVTLTRLVFVLNPR